MPATWAASIRWLRTFCPYEVRYLRRPSRFTSSGCSATHADFQHRPLAGVTNALLHLGLRPSRRLPRSKRDGFGHRRPVAPRRSGPTSRRTGSKAESDTASGVSSTMMLTPVIASNARMLRPSRPMIRPFMSSDGRGDHRNRRLGHHLRRQPLDGGRSGFGGPGDRPLLGP